MDFNDTQEEAAFRAEARLWLETNTRLKNPDDPGEDVLGERSSPETIQAAQAWQAKKADAGWACIITPSVRRFSSMLSAMASTCRPEVPWQMTK